MHVGQILKIKFTEVIQMVNALSYPAEILVSFRIEVLVVCTLISLLLAQYSAQHI